MYRQSLRPPVDLDAPEVSVVVPLFNEQENIEQLYRRTVRALDAIGCSYELLLVNDGSRDATPQLLDRLQKQDASVVVLHLSRNFGHQAAISAGIDHARGDAVIVMDGDLQDPPEVVHRLIEAWREGHDVVYAVRTQRKEGLAKRLGYALFYRLFRAISDIDIPLDSGDFCLMDRAVVETLRRLPERQRFVRGLRSFVGFRQTGITYERAGRNAGKPKYTFAALVRLALDGLIGFSGVPLNLVTYLGMATAALAALWTIGLAGHCIANHVAPAGWASAILVVLYTSAVQLVSLGIVSEYIRRIFLETKQRPTYIVRELRRQEPPPLLSLPRSSSSGHFLSAA
jgi:dolichol-phosphate mannosyltransferase